VALGGHGGTGGGGWGWGWWWSGPSGAGAGARAAVEALADGGSCGDEDDAAWWELETTAQMRSRDAVVAATTAAARESARGSALSTAGVDGTESGMAAAATESAYRAVRRAPGATVEWWRIGCSDAAFE